MAIAVAIGIAPSANLGSMLGLDSSAYVLPGRLSDALIYTTSVV